MHKNAERVVAAAREAGLTIEIVAFDEATRTAEEAARAVGVEVGQIVKSLVFAVGESSKQAEPGEIVVALVSGSNQLDERKLAAAAGAKKAWRIDADAVRGATGYAVGGIPPLGFPAPLRTFADVDLLQHPVVWAAAGTPNHNFASDPNELVRAVGATPSDLAKRTSATP